MVEKENIDSDKDSIVDLPPNSHTLNKGLETPN